MDDFSDLIPRSMLSLLLMLSDRPLITRFVAATGCTDFFWTLRSIDLLQAYQHTSVKIGWRDTGSGSRAAGHGQRVTGGEVHLPNCR